MIKILAEDKSFHSFLKCCLDVGNAINLGTRRGNAIGYKLESFRSFASCKSNNGKDYLLPYIVEKVVNQQPEVMDFYEDLQEYVIKGLGFDLEDVIADLGSLKSTFTQLKTFIDHSKKSNPPDQSFIDKFESFQSDNEPAVLELETIAVKTREEFFGVCVKLGNDMNKIKDLKTSVLIAQFQKVFFEIGKSLQNAKSDKEKKEKKEKKERRRRELAPSEEQID